MTELFDNLVEIKKALKEYNEFIIEQYPGVSSKIITSTAGKNVLIKIKQQEEQLFSLRKILLLMRETEKSQIKRFDYIL